MQFGAAHAGFELTLLLGSAAFSFGFLYSSFLLLPSHERRLHHRRGNRLEQGNRPAVGVTLWRLAKRVRRYQTSPPYISRLTWNHRLQVCLFWNRPRRPAGTPFLLLLLSALRLLLLLSLLTFLLLLLARLCSFIIVKTVAAAVHRMEERFKMLLKRKRRMRGD